MADNKTVDGKAGFLFEEDEVGFFEDCKHYYLLVILMLFTLMYSVLCDSIPILQGVESTFLVTLGKYSI